ncbi:hypothetical protein DFH28DRAFT_923140 [Melampsora americana]|nr:hypothetical protein DFH28DRAFT_923140 [Melampsora americana]
MSQPIQLPEIPDFDNLTDQSIWQWISCFLGWHLPALSEASKKITFKTWNELPKKVKKVFFRSDLLPHKIYDLDSFDSESVSVIQHYSLTWNLRSSSIRDIHCIFRNPKKNKVERYSQSHQIWLPESELRWLKIFKGSKKKIKFQNKQYPIGLRFITTHPTKLNQEKEEEKVEKVEVVEDQIKSIKKNTFGEMKSICFDGKRATRNSGYWPMMIGNKIKLGQSNDLIQFDYLQNQLGGMKLPKVELGWIWIENGIWGPKNRVLFKKTSLDESIGILIWPQLPGETSEKTSKPTPRIPVYEGDTVELADNDRILVFVGKARGVNDAVLQINVAYQWVRSLAGSNMAETKYSYPNPCERYPHCVRRPIYSPRQGDEPEILEHPHFPITEHPDLTDRFNEARKGESTEFFNQKYQEAQESVLKDLNQGIIPEVMKEFIKHHPSKPLIEIISKLNSGSMRSTPKNLMNPRPEYTVEFPPEMDSTEFKTQATDEYVIEILDEIEDCSSHDLSNSPALKNPDPTILRSSSLSPPPSSPLLPQPGPSCLKKTFTSSNLKRAYEKDEDEDEPGDLKRRRSVTFAKECESDSKGKGKMKESISIEDLSDERDENLNPSRLSELSNRSEGDERDEKLESSSLSELSNGFESEESEGSFTRRRSKRTRSDSVNESEWSERDESCPMPTASFESSTHRVDCLNLNCSQDFQNNQERKEKGKKSLRRSTRSRRLSFGSNLSSKSDFNSSDQSEFEIHETNQSQEIQEIQEIQVEGNSNSVKRKRKDSKDE